MIIENAVEFVLAKILSLLANYETVKLPIEAINALSTLTAYGTWVVGADILGIFVASVLFWFAVKGVVGLIIWAYELVFSVT